MTALESAGILQFSSAALAVPETAGLAEFQVVRIDGSKGAVTVNYQTVAVNATPGLDFTPTSGTLSFASGQTTATIVVPVLADPWDDQDEYVNVVLTSPGGGASLGRPARHCSRIIDVDPDTTPLQVSQLSWTGTSRSITSVNLTFNAPLDPSFALDPANYQLVAPGAGSAVPVTPVCIQLHDAHDHAGAGGSACIRPVLCNPGRRRRSDGDSRPAGNLLAGAANRLPGFELRGFFRTGQATELRRQRRQPVTLKLSGPGTWKQIRDATGEGVLLDSIGAVPKHSTLSGSVHAAPARGSTAASERSPNRRAD